MVTEAKKQEVEKLHAKFSEATSAVFVDMTGITVEDVTALRKTLRSSNALLKVVKNTLAKRAVAQTPYECAADLFKGPVSVALTLDDDITSSAKTLVEHAKTNSAIRILGGVVEGTLLDNDAVKQLAMTPPKPVVQAMLLGLLQAPARDFMGVMEAVSRKFLYALNAIAEKKNEQG